MTCHTSYMPKKTFYLTQQNKDKIDLVRGSLSASRVINKALEYLDVDTLRSWIDLPPLEAINPTQTEQTTDNKTVDAPQDPPNSMIIHD